MVIQFLKKTTFSIILITGAFLLSPTSLAQSPGSDPVEKSVSIPRKEIQLELLSSILAKHLLWLKGESTGEKADLGQTDLKGVDLRGLDLERAQFIQADLSQSNLSRAKLSGANLSRVDLTGANLSEANLSGADLTWVVLTDADLSWANLTRADLSRVNLTRAKLNATDLSMTDLGRANFHGAIVTGAIFSKAKLSRADLSSSIGLIEAIWGDGVYYDANTKWPTGYPAPRNLGTLQGKIALFVEKYWLTIVLSSLLFLAVLVSFTVYRWNLKIKEKTKELEKGKKSLKEITGMVEFVEAVLKVASLREEVAMTIAQGRSGRLFIIGSFLMVLSVFAPFGSAIIYWQTDPLDDEVVMNLVQLKAKTGIVPGNESISLQKDWRILFSGLSFGFLFLAAARGILRQEARQSTTYVKNAERVSYYENLARALLINERLQGEAGQSQNDELVRRIIEKLFASPEETQEDKASKDSDATESVPFMEQAETLVNAFKRAPG